MTIGARIREARESAGLSLSELARRADVSKGYLSGIESEYNESVSARILCDIATQLNVSIVYLITGQHEPIAIEDRPILPALEAFATEANLAPHEIKMLSNINYRGRYIDNRDDFRYIWESIKRSVRR